MSVIRACAHCRKPFEATRRDARYCTPAHRQAALRARRSVTEASPEPATTATSRDGGPPDPVAEQHWDDYLWHGDRRW